MTASTLAERTVMVAGKPISVAEKGSGPAVLMLHGGGPAPPGYPITPGTSMRSAAISV
ncbi:2-hydroxy-6-ketonona-2,4-dienedioic acid hydrolase domain protein [Mycobacterium kansasii]|uniref:2-hydroxy-6-ketonona-2,4-dienedioic acid hydrolase domain protein n=1 Tax=Mycobacterium kansasii TaxID=1768 RepID=A0A1V3XU19_MYCKA|nr:2-hydroxy-6-ketonona-2,4-dienedioic acid hydrolase domain protein [Mycobacterium kansasii]